MNDRDIARIPPVVDALCRDTEAIGFTMASQPQTGALLRTLAASKPGGRLLELGTGTGVSTAWLLAGMDSRATLESVDSDPSAQELARRHLDADPRVTFHLADGAAFLHGSTPGRFDLIFADAWPGKFTHLELALALLRHGGFYVIDDLLPQPNWPVEHAPKVPLLVDYLERLAGFTTMKLAWASGLMIAVRTG